MGWFTLPPTSAARWPAAGGPPADGPRRPSAPLVELRPGFDESPLPSRQLAGDQLDRVNAEDGHVVLIVRVEVSAMVRATDLDEHANDDAEEPRELRHVNPHCLRARSTHRMGRFGTRLGRRSVTRCYGSTLRRDALSRGRSLLCPRSGRHIPGLEGPPWPSPSTSRAARRA